MNVNRKRNQFLLLFNNIKTLHTYYHKYSYLQFMIYFVAYDLYIIIKYVSSGPRRVLCAHRSQDQNCAVHRPPAELRTIMYTIYAYHL